MLVELGVAEQRHRAVVEVLDGAPVTVVAGRYGVSRQTVHRWLARYAGEGGLANLVDRSSRPGSCPHQMPSRVEVRVIGLRWQHRDWGPDRIRHQLAREGIVPVPSRSAVYRALVRNGLLDPVKRRRKRSDFRRWERGRAMELWQMDVMGGVHLPDGSEVKVVTGIDDHSRFVVCARVVARATAGPVCAALAQALRAHGVPEQILTDNGKVFTARFGLGPGPVRFDRICTENGIRHLLTAPYSPPPTRRPPPARWSDCTRRCGRSSSAGTSASTAASPSCRPRSTAGSTTTTPNDRTRAWACAHRSTGSGWPRRTRSSPWLRRRRPSPTPR